MRKLSLRRTIIAAGVAAAFGTLLTGAVLAHARIHPTIDADNIKCGGGMSAHDTFWWVPSDDAPTDPQDALATYLEMSAGLRQSARAASEFRLHQDSRRVEDLPEGGQLRYIHPTDDGFDADVRVVKHRGRFYVERAEVCAGG